MNDLSSQSGIDFVVFWVDGADKAWLDVKKKYNPGLNTDDAINRYRDWGLLKYWFRGVEKNTPWVDHVFFVTCGQKPDWLDASNPKLILVNHSDYIDEKYLPLFNSSAIECTVNKIPGLSEKFVLFNDDFYIINKMEPKDFYRNDKPVDQFVEDPIKFVSDEVFPYILLNNMILVKEYANKRKFLKEHFTKLINLKYGKYLPKTLLTLPFHCFTGIHNSHLPQPFLKKNYEELQLRKPEAFEQTLNNRFRAKTDITQYAIRYYQLLTGEFIPRGNSYGQNFELHNSNVEKVCKHIIRQKTKTICLNDTDTTIDFPLCKEKLEKAFEMLFPEKSCFEK